MIPATAVRARPPLAAEGHAPTTTMTDRRFFAVMAGFAVAGLALRLTYLFAAEHAAVSGDGFWYHFGGNYLADGKGFLNPYGYFFSGVTQPGATHPPGWTVVLGGGSMLGLRTVRAHAVLASCVGTATIPVVGAAGRRLTGTRTGVVAALFAALYPGFWIYEPQLLSETLAIFGAATTILLALRFLDRRTFGRVIAVGAACGCMALVRAEQILLFGFLLVPMVVLARSGSLRRRFGWLAAATATGVVVLAPWVGYNLARFQERTFITTSFGSTLEPGNCDAAYHGRYIGAWIASCGAPALRHFGLTGDYTLSAQLEKRHMDDSTVDAEASKLGLRYTKDHLTELPAVVLAREGRVWRVFRPFQQLRLDSLTGDLTVQRLELFAYWGLAALALYGVIVLRRRLPELVVLGSFVATAIVATALTAGQPRVRAPADVSLVLLAAVAVDALLRHVARRRSEKASNQEAMTVSSR